MTRYDILPPVQRALLPALRPLKDLGLVLYGGTAIALRLGHRQSVDFDFFAGEPLDRRRLRELIPLLVDADVLQDERDAWTVQVHPTGRGGGSVKLSFFSGLGFGRVGSPSDSDHGEMRMASLDDLMGHKLKVLLQRVEAKDYQDMAALLRHGLSLERGAGASMALFPGFPVPEALRTLTYFKEGDLSRLSVADREVLIRAAVAFERAVPIPILSNVLT